jgi:tripartite ATP-independent transporter DctM subunit
LLHTNIGASAVFSAVSGSSVATAATISTVALPSFRKRRYDTRLVLGSIAAGASLGNLIPPGIALIVYGAMTNTSVGQLYAAAVIPGIMMTVLFMGTIIMIALLKPDLVRQKEVAEPLAARLKRLVDLLPPLVIFGIIMGSIYTGWATVTESAAHHGFHQGSFPRRIGRQQVGEAGGQQGGVGQIFGHGRGQGLAGAARLGNPSILGQ